MEWTDKLLIYNQDVDTKIAGLYDLQYTIGRGHYAVVKLARHVFTGETVAVKVIDKTKLDDISRDHLFQEVVCMKLVQHPNVVRLYEVIDTPTKLYLILELGDGGDLYDYIINHGNGLDENTAKRYFHQIVTAIAYCHKLHVVHRDLKPENVVFFEKLGLVKLTDFGFSNKFIPGRHLDTACGSLAYSAPEILLGDPYDAPKVDIWSLGVMLYMLVSGKLPFQEVNDSETITKIMDCDYSLPPNVSSECKHLISLLLVKDPKKRACLDDILQSDWLRLDDNDMSIESLSVPLISREHLSFEDHMEILTKMSEGKLATVEEIQSTLESNEYNHLTATYYLLAERKLKRNYIEQYKALCVQAQLKEKFRQQELQEQHRLKLEEVDNGISSPTNVTAVTTTTTGSNIISPTTNTTPSTRILNSTVEERVRRFSMILEDEEEEEGNANFNHFSYNSYVTNMRGSVTTDIIANSDMHTTITTTTMTATTTTNYSDINITSNVYHTCLPETCDDVLLEEQEELATMVGLACVRSELLHEHSTSAVLLDPVEGEHTLVPGAHFSRISGYGAEASDGTESDASIGTCSTSGGVCLGANNVTNSLGRISSTTRSLPPLVDNRRKHIYRRGLIPHRPLITVKSSPQLLKHIAEEELVNASAGSVHLTNSPSDASNQLNKSVFDSNTNDKHFVVDDFRRCSLYNPHDSHRNIRYVDDQLIGLNPVTRFMHLSSQNPYSGTHSPTWTRRYFTTPCPSRPSSSGSWNTALWSLNLTNELQQRRLSHCSSPAECQSSINQVISNTGVVCRKKRLSHVNYSIHNQPHSQSFMLDRRCSGPPCLLLTIYGLSTNVPLPSCSGSIEPLSVNDDDEDDDIDMISHGDESSGTVHIGDTCTNFDEKPTQITKTLTKSPNRVIANDTRSTPTLWTNSAPILHEKTLEENQIVDSSRPNDSLACLNSLREQCTPIREEEDEVTRVVETTSSTVDNDDHRQQVAPIRRHDLEQKHNRRCSDSSSLFGNLCSLNESNIGHLCYAPLVESESASTINQLPDSKFHSLVDQLASTGLNSSNFSLSSLATSLRGSRHMIDVIRGTFELQCYKQRKYARSLATVSNQINASSHQSHHRHRAKNKQAGLIGMANRVQASNSLCSLTTIGGGDYYPQRYQRKLNFEKFHPTRNHHFPALNTKLRRQLSATSASLSSSSVPPLAITNTSTVIVDRRDCNSRPNTTNTTSQSVKPNHEHFSKSKAMHSLNERGNDNDNNNNNNQSVCSNKSDPVCESNEPANQGQLVDSSQGLTFHTPNLTASIDSEKYCNTCKQTNNSNNNNAYLEAAKQNDKTVPVRSDNESDRTNALDWQSNPMQFTNLLQKPRTKFTCCTLS